MTPIIDVKAFRCSRCGHVWLPRDYSNKIHNEEKIWLPVACAKCKSAYWDRDPATTTATTIKKKKNISIKIKNKIKKKDDNTR
jgi:Zn-finger nucleic acid-binding protein